MCAYMYKLLHFESKSVERSAATKVSDPKGL